MRRTAVTAILAGLLALATALPAQASTIALGTRDAAYAPNGNFTRGRVEVRVAGIYNTETNDTYGRGRAEIVKGARRLVAYYQREYEAQALSVAGTCATGFHIVTLTPTTARVCVRLITANEEDVYSGEGSLPEGVVRISTDTERAPGACLLATKNGLGIRWDSGVLGARGTWSRVFRNPAEPVSASCPA